MTVSNPEWVSPIRLVLAAAAALGTAVGALGAGATTSGLLVRTALGGVLFLLLGTAFGRLVSWCLAPVPGRSKALPGVKGQALDVTLPAVQPPDA
jgi:hypothetical protein